MEVDNNKEWKVFKCIVGVHKSGTPFHYFKKVNNISKKGLYVVEGWIDDNNRDTVMMFYDKKEIELFGEVLDIIEELKTQKLRDKKISQIIC